MKVPVLFPKIFDYPFTYKSEISQKLTPGDFVKAPFGSSEVTGVVWPHEQKTEKKFKLKKISKKINVKNLNSSMIKFITWFSKYNLVSLGMSFKMCLLNKDVVEKSFNKEFDRFKIKKGKNKFLLNGEQKKFDPPMTVEQLLGEIGLDPRKVAVERNLEIVPKSNYAGISLDDGDRLEIIHFIGGGAPDEAKAKQPQSLSDDDTWEVAGKRFKSRLIIGTGKYEDYEVNRLAAEAAGAEIITVAIRRVNLDDPSKPLLVDYLDPKKYTYLPNTAGCFNAEDAVRTCKLARELLDGHSLVKLEVLGDPTDPAVIAALSDEGLRACGFSRQKTGYARSLAEEVISGRLNLDHLPEDDEEAIAQLVRVKGIGRWSAEVYLLFAEGRPDIWPAGDLAVQIEVGRILGLPERPSERLTRELAEAWRPYRGAAAIFTWHHYGAGADVAPV